MTHTNPLLQVDGLSVSYGKVRALEQVSLRIPPGEVVTVIGPNGAGKSTLLNGIMGTLPADVGQVCLDGEPLFGPPERRLGVGLALVPETRELFPSMSVEDNLLLGGYLRHRRRERGWRDTLDEVYALFPRLKERLSQEAGSLSGGERQMLAIGRAMMSKPRVLMLDEPSLGLAPLIVIEIFKVVADLKRHGISTLLVEQNAKAALQLASYAYVLENGCVSMEGATEDLMNDPRVIDSYLGLGKKSYAEQLERVSG